MSSIPSVSSTSSLETSSTDSTTSGSKKPSRIPRWRFAGSGSCVSSEGYVAGEVKDSEDRKDKKVGWLELLRIEAKNFISRIPLLNGRLPTTAPRFTESVEKKEHSSMVEEKKCVGSLGVRFSGVAVLKAVRRGAGSFLKGKRGERKLKSCLKDSNRPQSSRKKRVH